MAADNTRAIGFLLSGGQAGDAPRGRLLIDAIGRIREPGEDSPAYLLMDRAYKDGKTRWPAFEWGYSPVAPPKKKRKNPWEYDKEIYKQRKEVERMFLRLKGCRRIGTRHDKLDMLYSAYTYLAVCLIAGCSLIPSCVNRP